MGLYSIFLVPPENVRRAFLEILLILKEKHSLPFFEPHVTLIGDVSGEEKDIINKTKELSKILKPFSLQLSKKLSHSDAWHKQIFVEVERTKELMQANRKAQEIFKVSDKYEPHLSLLYGNFPPEAREKIIKNINQKLNLKFNADKLYLYSIEGKAPNWHQVTEFKVS